MNARNHVSGLGRLVLTTVGFLSLVVIVLTTAGMVFLVVIRVWMMHGSAGLWVMGWAVGALVLIQVAWSVRKFIQNHRRRSVSRLQSTEVSSKLEVPPTSGEHPGSSKGTSYAHSHHG